MKRCKSTLKRLSLYGLAMLALHPATLFACSACYGQSDSPMARGMNWGIFTLLGVVVCVLGTIASFFVYLGKRSATIASSDESDAASEPGPEVRP
jgi:hypothetical protein